MEKIYVFFIKSVKPLFLFSEKTIDRCGFVDSLLVMVLVGMVTSAALVAASPIGFRKIMNDEHNVLAEPMAEPAPSHRRTDDPACTAPGVKVVTLDDGSESAVMTHDLTNEQRARGMMTSMSLLHCPSLLQ